MSANLNRVNSDLDKIEKLSELSGGKIEILNKSNKGLELQLHYKTIENKSGKTSESTRVKIEFTSRYPFVPPKVLFKTKVFHPHVYENLTLCIGNWKVTETLDLLVKRIINVLIYDLGVIDEKSPANSSALNWYRKNKKKFPLDESNFEKQKEKKKIKWGSTTTSSEKVIVNCPHCDTQLRLPAGKSGNIKCPNCGEKFFAET